jgi:hypothetical protein
MSEINPYFNSTEIPKTTPKILPLIAQIFTRTFKNSHLVENYDVHSMERSQKIPYKHIVPFVDYQTIYKWVG